VKNEFFVTFRRIFGGEWWCVGYWWVVICEEESRCTICGERNEVGVKCVFCVNLWKLVFFGIFENEFWKNNKIKKNNWCKVVIFVIRNVIAKRRIEIGMFSVMKLSFLENEVTK